MSSTTAKLKPLPNEAVEITKRNAHKKRKLKPAMPVWTGDEYARIAPGRYTATAVRIIGPEYLGRWKRQSVGIAFCPFSEPNVEVVLFLNLATGEPKRGSDYYRNWTRANGGPPTKGEVMDPSVFLDGQIYEIEVYDADIDPDGNHKSDAEVYSKVRRIVSVQRRGQAPVGVVPFKGKPWGPV